MDQDALVTARNIRSIQDTLEDKVDADLFDKEIGYCKGYLEALIAKANEGKDAKDFLPPPTPSTGGLSTKDGNRLKELLPRMDSIEKLVQDHKDDFND